MMSSTGLLQESAKEESPRHGEVCGGDSLLLEVDRLSIELPNPLDRRYAVEEASFHLNVGELRCIVGESGSGKSLTARAIMGLLPHQGIHRFTGSVRFRGREILGLPDSHMMRLRGREIGMVFQEPMTALNPLKKVKDQIGELFDIHGIRMTRTERRERILNLLEEMNLPDSARIAEAYPFELSGGQRQRVVIAMACALEPALLIADEPTTALDVTTQKQILALFDSIRRRHNTAILLITHDFGVVAQIADTICVMKDGRIVEQGNARAIIRNPHADYTRSLLAAIPQIRLEDRNSATFDDRPIMRVMGMDKRFRVRRNAAGRSSQVHALRSVSFEIRKGEALGVVGESGSGKSTLSRCITGLVEADSGEMEVLGRRLARLDRPALRYLRNAVQMVFQDPFSSLNPRKRVVDIVAAGPRANGIGRREARKLAADLLQTVGLGESAGRRYPHEFSGGQRQRIGIARALALRPAILIADEAVSALDVTIQAQILDLFREIREREQLALLFITHDLRVAAEVCDRIIVMKDGEIVDEGDPRHIFKTSTVAYTRSLIDAIPGRELV